MSHEKSRLAILDVLRAIAALSVCLFHLNRYDGSLLADCLHFGHYGVEIFFVVSGFIIPTALYWSKFQYRDSGNFLLRRWVRLYPVFFVAALAHLLFSHIGSPLLGFGGNSPDLTWARALANFTLSCEFVGQDWYQTIFWTLSIEAQYYLLMVVSFPLLTHENRWVQTGALLLWVVPPYFVGSGPSIFTWTAFFSMGILVFLKKQQLISSRAFWIYMVVAAYSHEASRNLISTCIGVGTALLILYSPQIKLKWMVKLGAISYSLYLLHILIGGAVLVHLKNVLDPMRYMVVSILLATAVAIAVSALFYKYLELPCHNLARSLKSRERPKAGGATSVDSI